jgi:hypothetical protein
VVVSIPCTKSALRCLAPLVTSRQRSLSIYSRLFSADRRSDRAPPRRYSTRRFWALAYIWIVLNYMRRVNHGRASIIFVFLISLIPTNYIANQLT